METSAEMMVAPDNNGRPTLPKQSATRSMVPTTWLARSLRVEYVGAAGDARETTATLLDWCPVGLLLNIAGANTLLCWERVVRCELIEG
jgi:hypothetical protein